MTERSYPFIGFFEDSDGAGVEGLTDLTIDAKKVLRTDLTSRSSFLSGVSVTSELGGGFYAYQGLLMDLELYDFPFKMTTADAGVAFKEVPGMIFDHTDITSLSLATAAALAVVDGNVDDILVDTGTTLPAQIDTLLLKNSATAAASGVDGSDLTLTNKLTFSETISNLTIPATWQKAYVTVKEDLDDPDSEAILQVLVSATPDSVNDGITYVNKTAATAAQRLYGSLVVNQSAGTILWNVKDDMTFTNTTRKYTYDIKFLITGSDSEKPAGSANFTIKATETKTV